MKKSTKLKEYRGEILNYYKAYKPDLDLKLREPTRSNLVNHCFNKLQGETRNLAKKDKDCTRSLDISTKKFIESTRKEKLKFLHNKFKTVEEFLNNKKDIEKNPNSDICDITAWLIGYPNRPYLDFKKADRATIKNGDIKKIRISDDTSEFFVIMKFDGNEHVIRFYLKDFVYRITKKEKEVLEKIKLENDSLKKDNNSYEGLNNQIGDIDDEIDFISKEILIILQALEKVQEKRVLIDNLYQRALKEFFDGNITSVLKVLNEEILLSREESFIKNKNIVSEARIFRAQILFLTHEIDQAEYNYERATIVNEVWHTCIETAKFFHRNNKFKKAKKYYIKSIELTFDIYQEFQSKKNYGNLLCIKEVGEFQYAKQNLEAALKIIEQLIRTDRKYLQDLISTNVSLGINYHYLNDYKTAEKHYNEAIKLDKVMFEYGPKYKLSFANELSNYSMLLRENKNKQRLAKKYCKEALKIRKYFYFKNTKNIKLANAYSESLNNLGLIQKDYHKFKTASKHIKESLKIREKNLELNSSKYLPLIWKSYFNLGDIYYSIFTSSKEKSNSYSEAFKFYTLAIDCYNKLGNDKEKFKILLAELKHNFAVLISKKGHKEKALKLLDESMLIKREWAKIETSDKPKEYIAYTMNTIAGIKCQDINAKDEVLKYLLEVKDLYKGLNKKNKSIYEIKFGISCYNLSTFLAEEHVGEYNVSRKNLNLAIEILKNYDTIPYIKNQLADCSRLDNYLKYYGF